MTQPGAAVLITRTALRCYRCWKPPLVGTAVCSACWEEIHRGDVAYAIRSQREARIASYHEKRRQWSAWDAARPLPDPWREPVRPQQSHLSRIVQEDFSLLGAYLP